MPRPCTPKASIARNLWSEQMKDAVNGDYRQTRALVTGGAGFLGSHICERLLAQDIDVICADNLYTGSKRNVSHLLDNPNFEFIRHDITFPLYVEVDQIYNMACPASPVHYQRNPVQTTKTAVHGSINMLGLAKRVGATLYQASTSEVYGDPLQHPQVESYWGHVNPIGPRACYDEGKRCAETLCFDYVRQYDLPVKVGRIFNTYGPRMALEDGRVISNFIVQALQNQPITVFGDGSQSRSFCFVDELVEAILRFMQTPRDFPGPMNLGNPAEVPIGEVAELVRSLVGSSSEIIFKDMPSDDPRQRCPDISLAREKLDWSPSVSLEEGLSRTIPYFEGLLRAI